MPEQRARLRELVMCGGDKMGDLQSKLVKLEKEEDKDLG